MLAELTDADGDLTQTAPNTIAKGGTASNGAGKPRPLARGKPGWTHQGEREESRPRHRGAGLDETQWFGGSGMFFFVVEEGQRVLMRRSNGTMQIIVGPRKVCRGWSRFLKMEHYVA